MSFRDAVLCLFTDHFWFRPPVDGDDATPERRVLAVVARCTFGDLRECGGAADPLALDGET